MINIIITQAEYVAIFELTVNLGKQC